MKTTGRILITKEVCEKINDFHEGFRTDKDIIFERDSGNMFLDEWISTTKNIVIGRGTTVSVKDGMQSGMSIKGRGDIGNTGYIHTGRDITIKGYISSTSDITAKGSISAGGYIHSDGSIRAEGNIKSDDFIMTDCDIETKGTIMARSMSARFIRAGGHVITTHGGIDAHGFIEAANGIQSKFHIRCTDGCIQSNGDIMSDDFILADGFITTDTEIKAEKSIITLDGDISAKKITCSKCYVGISGRRKRKVIGELIEVEKGVTP